MCHCIRIPLCLYWQFSPQNDFWTLQIKSYNFSFCPLYTLSLLKVMYLEAVFCSIKLISAVISSSSNYIKSWSKLRSNNFKRAIIILKEQLRNKVSEKQKMNEDGKFWKVSVYSISYGGVYGSCLWRLDFSSNPWKMGSVHILKP